jgi:hypothetical protein
MLAQNAYAAASAKASEAFGSIRVVAAFGGEWNETNRYTGAHSLCVIPCAFFRSSPLALWPLCALVCYRLFLCRVRVHFLVHVRVCRVPCACCGYGSPGTRSTCQTQRRTALRRGWLRAWSWPASSLSCSSCRAWVCTLACTWCWTSGTRA